jgi:hypothetical protein
MVPSGSLLALAGGSSLGTAGSSQLSGGSSAGGGPRPGDRSRFRFRRFSAIMQGAVSAMAQTLGITSSRQDEVARVEKMDTARLAQETLDIKVVSSAGCGCEAA